MSENRTKLVCVAIRSTCVPHFTNIIHIHPNNPNNIKFINKTHESNKSNSINMLSNWSHSAAMYLDYFQREIHAKFWSSDQYHCIFYPFIHTENSVPFYYFFFPVAYCCMRLFFIFAPTQTFTHIIRRCNCSDSIFIGGTTHISV